MAINKDAVFKAAEEIRTEGGVPTLTLIRDRIGGSYSTIGPFLREWKELTTQEKEAINLPQEIIDMSMLLATKVWSASNTEAEKGYESKLSEIRKEYETKIISLEDERTELFTVTENLELELSKEREKSKELQQSLDTQLNLIEQLKAENLTYKSHLSELIAKVKG